MLEAVGPEVFPGWLIEAEMADRAPPEYCTGGLEGQTVVD